MNFDTKKKIFEYSANYHNYVCKKDIGYLLNLIMFEWETVNMRVTLMLLGGLIWQDFTRFRDTLLPGN